MTYNGSVFFGDAREHRQRGLVLQERSNEKGLVLTVEGEPVHLEHLLKFLRFGFAVPHGRESGYAA
jgi:hypothetical protein